MNLWRSIIWPNENYIQFLQFFLFHVSIFITSIFIQNSPKQSLHNTSCITNRYLACPTKNQHYFRIALTEYDLSQIFSTSIPQTFIHSIFIPWCFPFSHTKRESQQFLNSNLHNILIFLLDSRQQTSGAARVGFVEIFAAWLRERAVIGVAISRRKLRAGTRR